ncbi:hypothetical protein [Lysobacter sp. OAE881]|uniref:DUF6414 family protein n=1 Tax=Lysobacter sp. OAE881 TaxID=2663813 RepID=UPI0019FD1AC5
MLYDYLYVDLPKVISLYSQLTGGVIESRETTNERAQSSDNKRSYDFRVFRHDAGGTADERSGIKEVIKPHHSILRELEEGLSSQGHLLDLDSLRPPSSLRNPEVRELLKTALCVKVTGRAVVEDYERIKSVAADFPAITKVVNTSIQAGVRRAPAFMDLESRIESIAHSAKQEKDRNRRAAAEAEVRKLRAEITDALAEVKTIDGVDQWILDGLRTWIDTFLPGIINLRVYPSLERADEHVFGHLKRECFEDTDAGSFHFTYGSVPTEPLSMIGVITSVPTELVDTFNPLAEFADGESGSAETVENGFRGLFRGFDGFEQMIRTCRFPRVLVQPLIVYRSVSANASLRKQR